VNQPGDILAGVGVLITRPAHQSQILAELVRRQGGQPVLFPALEIEALEDGVSAIDAGALARLDLAVFVSPNAARIPAARIAAAGGLPPHVRVAAVGPATAAELRRELLKSEPAREIITGQTGFDSEALLQELPRDAVTGRRIAIFRGAGGRQLLGETLRSRGALVEFFECYRRRRPAGDLGELLPRWASGEIQACTATSAEIVGNLFGMADVETRRRLQDTPMFVPHARVAGAAFAQRVRTIVSAGGGDEALAGALGTWFARAGQK